MLKFIVGILVFSSVATAQAANCKTETRCEQQRVCKYICTLTAGAASGTFGGPAAGAGISLGGQVCGEVCEMIPDCRTGYFCDPYVAPKND